MKNIVIIGGGAGGLELVIGLARKLKKNSEFNIVLVDKEKTHIWKPHLHEVAAGSLDSHYEQVDYLNLASKFNFEFVWGEMSNLNKDTKTITVKAKLNSFGEEILPEREVKYDNLIIAVGSTSNYYQVKFIMNFIKSIKSFIYKSFQSINKYPYSLIFS